MIQEYGKAKAEEIIEYSFNNSVDPNIAVIPPHMKQQQQTNATSLAQIQQYNQLMQQFNSKTRIIPPNINKFSPAYSRIIAAKPKASAPAKVDTTIAPAKVDTTIAPAKVDTTIAPANAVIVPANAIITPAKTVLDWSEDWAKPPQRQNAVIVEEVKTKMLWSDM